MTLTLDRSPAGGGGVEEPARNAARARVEVSTSPLARLVLASLLLGPAVIHFGMIPSHAGESAVEGVGFALTGWLGALLGIGMIVRPSRRIVVGAGLLSAAMVAIWVRSRTAGLPFGAHAGHKEAATGIDLLATGMEVAAVLSCAALLIRPGIGRRLGIGGGVIGAAIAGFAMIASSMALASPSARDHASTSHGDHVHAATTTGLPAEVGIHEGILTGADTAGSDAAGHVHNADGSTTGASSDGAATGVAASTDGTTTGTASTDGVATNAADGSTPTGGSSAAGVAAGDSGAGATGHTHGSSTPAAVPVSALASRCDLGFNPVSFWNETNIVNEGAADPSKIAGSAELDQLIAATGKAGGEAKDAAVVAMLGKTSNADYDSWLNWLPTYLASAHAHTTSGAVDDNGGHGGHLGPQPWVPMTDQAQCDQLASELARAKAVALKYPHPGDAEAAGWHKVTGFVPGIAAHYMNFAIVDGTFDIDQPEMLLYDGVGPDASIVGLSYYMIHDSDFEPTQGFTGPNDHFHRHIGLCVNGTGVIGDSTTTDAECTARGGVKQGGAGGWMNHVWIVPGCESPWGMFSGASPLLEDSLTASSGTDGGGCAGSGVRDRFDLSPATPNNVPPVVVGKSAPTA